MQRSREPASELNPSGPTVAVGAKTVSGHVDMELSHTKQKSLQPNPHQLLPRHMASITLTSTRVSLRANVFYPYNDFTISTGEFLPPHCILDNDAIPKCSSLVENLYM